jgi:two-component system CheB/CheR fusion protein
MALNQIYDMKDYRRYLRQNPQEVTDLFKDLTINVTSFFRDKVAFQQLSKIGIRRLMKKKKADNPFRIWVPACATGEEAYSLAILMVEAAEALEKFFDIRIFATDINADAIESARRGEFPENIRVDISDERLRRFFIKKGPKYCVDSKIRDLMVFAVHDVTRDPPFSNMELISCRNLLIYMDNDLQKQVLPILHYALKPGGILFLGGSETVGEAYRFFTPLDKTNKIYQYNEVDSELSHRIHIPAYHHHPEKDPETTLEKSETVPRPTKRKAARELVERTILEKYSPSAVLIDEASEILYFHGETGRYLSPPVGDPNFNIFNLVHGELHVKLSQALGKVKEKRAATRIDGVQVRHNDEFLSLDLICTPLSLMRNKSHYILVEFKEHAPKEQIAEKRSTNEEDPKNPVVHEIEQKLRVTRQELQATIEELETANEELKSSNEELQANNEELQSTNEELESSKEELQSTNEELETLNAELSKKNQDLIKAEDDLNNLFSSTEIGTIFLDNDLNVKRFTPAAKEIFNLREERDIGRCIKDITNSLQYNTLDKDADEVLDKLIRKDVKIQSKNGTWYVVRIVPYRTRGNVIEGVVITFLHMAQYEDSELYVRDVKSFFYNTMSALWEPVMILDETLRIIMANRAFLRIFKTTPKETEDRSIFELDDKQWDIPELRKILEGIIPHDNEFEGFEVEHDFPGIGRRKMVLNARKIAQGEARPAMILLSFRDVADS